jgi:hypothetical protein
MSWKRASIDAQRHFRPVVGERFERGQVRPHHDERIADDQRTDHAREREQPREPQRDAREERAPFGLVAIAAVAAVAAVVAVVVVTVAVADVVPDVA